MCQHLLHSSLCHWICLRMEGYPYDVLILQDIHVESKLRPYIASESLRNPKIPPKIGTLLRILTSKYALLGIGLWTLRNYPLWEWYFSFPIRQSIIVRHYTNDGWRYLPNSPVFFTWSFCKLCVQLSMSSTDPSSIQLYPEVFEVLYVRSNPRCPTNELWHFSKTADLTSESSSGPY